MLSIALKGLLSVFSGFFWAPNAALQYVGIKLIPRTHFFAQLGDLKLLQRTSQQCNEFLGFLGFLDFCTGRISVLKGILLITVLY